MPTVLITGANRGIGLEFARQYAADGWQVIATCRTPEKAEALQDLTRRYGCVQLESLDVTDQASINSCAARLQEVVIDILINNAGRTAQGKGLIGWDEATGAYTGTLDPDAWRNVINVNTVGPIMTTLALLPNIKQGTLRKIIMISSRCGSVEASLFPEYISYNCSKAALNIGMRNLAKLLKPQGITFASLHPGNVQTDMGGPNAEITVDQSVSGMRRVISDLTLSQSGCFVGYDGRVWPF